MGERILGFPVAFETLQNSRASNIWEQIIFMDWFPTTGFRRGNTKVQAEMQTSRSSCLERIWEYLRYKNKSTIPGDNQNAKFWSRHGDVMVKAKSHFWTLSHSSARLKPNKAETDKKHGKLRDHHPRGLGTILFNRTLQVNNPEYYPRACDYYNVKAST